MMRRLACAVATLIAGAMPASAQTFPTRSLTILVPYVAGGPTDAAARIVGEHMAATLGQHVLIEALGSWTGLAPGVVVGLLVVVLLVGTWILARARRWHMRGVSSFRPPPATSTESSSPASDQARTAAPRCRRGYCAWQLP